MNSASRGAAIENFDLGTRQYKQEQWLEAACSFDKAIQLGSKDPRAYESKAKCYLRQSQLETKEFARKKTGSDGNAMYEAAYRTALRAMQKYGKERWQPFYILADILYHRQQYTLAESYLAKIPPHPSFTNATTQQRASVKMYAERIAHDRRYVRQRVTGRAETEAVVNDLQRADEMRRRTNFEQVLSPDIFLRIVEVARDSDPRLAVRMSGVCQRWRGILVGQPGVWQRLVLGKGPYVGFKVKTYLERCGRGLKELQITEGFDASRADEVGKLLAPHARHIRRLTVRLRSPKPILGCFRGLMENLEYLNIQPPVEIRSTAFQPTTRLDFDLLPRKSSSLREIHLRGVEFLSARAGEEEDGESSDDDLDTEKSRGWVEDPQVQLRNLHILRLEQTLTGTNSMLELFQHTPNIREVHLDRSICRHDPTEPKPTPTRLEHLKVWSMLNGHPTLRTGTIPFSYISAPNLDTLDLGTWLGTSAHLVTALEAEGLREALPKLRSLNLAKIAIDDTFLPLFRQMTALGYLNLSRCSLPTSFLDALANGTNETAPLLPNLVALSLAGNIELNAPILRDLVNSRLPEEDKIPIPSIASQKSSQKRSMFAATPGNKSLTSGSSRRTRTTSQSNISPIKGNTGPASHSPSTQLTTQPSIVLETPLSTSPTPVARLRWLNIDHCEGVDTLLLPSLAKRIPFVSQWMGTPDEDRIAGKGRWSWELDLSLECRMKIGTGGPVDEPRCEIKANGKGGYVVHHVCGQGQSSQKEAEKGWQWTSQFTQPSQNGAGWNRKAKDRDGRAVKSRLAGLQEE